MNFASRLVLGTFTIVVFTLLVLAWGSERALRTGLEREVRTTLEREARLIAEVLPADPTTWPSAIQRMGVQSTHRIVVRDSSGAEYTSGDSLKAEKIVTVQVEAGPGLVEVSAPLEGVDEAVRRTRGSISGAALLALLVALVLAFIAGRSIASPLVALSGAARAIAAGALPRFPRSGIPEVDALVQALRQMNRQLAERFEELRREKAGSTAIVDAMVEGIVAADPKGRIVIANPAARRLLGYGPEAPLPDLRTLFRAKAAREAVDEVLDGTAIHGREVELDSRILLVNARSLEGGGAVLVLHDLTEVRRLESVRRDFVANVSHELKTPLTSISGYAETLAEGDVDEATRARFLGTIVANARRMQRLVDDLLDLSRIESGRWTPHLEPIALGPLASDSLHLFTDRAEARGITLDVDVADDAATLTADADAVRQVLTNLVDNAMRYVPDGGHVTIRAVRDGVGIRLTVADNGSGIAADHLPRIFERFYRVDASRSREEGGTGLGLAIVRHIVEAHKGRVHAESVPRQGTTIVTWWPVGS